ncbi:hypothetical protein NA8A_00125 [Nitratireductor indicus C115]|uniref:Uncharacterized protein n=1 Tax=Nitratireductor indicus C115 TaxID=1231190 RepID=K2PAG3_9HYPH|nr:hypothetical protein [Nitratireductor indicus]EKF44101.1 hypothetical protein NA8A_00125 [Nitratireductor indicus C115]SFQ23333.1 hypothetical protein SAMN05216176_10221 [Nitratireductor indicus]
MQILSLKSIVAGGLALCVVLFAIGWYTRDNPANAPYLKILGGGFMFNYREGEVFYGFTALVVRPLASGSIIEASFENPAGGAPLVVAERVSTMTNRYALRTPPLRGVEAKKPYHVAIKVYDREKKALLWAEEHSYSSQISDTVVPEKPLTIGPGYHLNPDNPENRRPG